MDKYCLVAKGMDKKQTKIILHVVKRLPYPDQISNIDLKEKDVIRLTWRKYKLRITENYFVEEIDDGMLAGTDFAMILKQLFKFPITERSK